MATAGSNAFSAAMNGEDLPEVQEAVVETTEVEAAPAVETEVEAPAEKTVEAPEPQAREHNVPSWRVKEEADKRREAEDRASKLDREHQEAMRRLKAYEEAEQKKEPETFDWTNPDGFVQKQVETVQQAMERQVQQMNERNSLRWAVKDHGQEKVAAARKDFDSALSSRDPQAVHAYQQAMQSDDPYAVILGWHQQSTTLKEIGGDLNGYRQRIMDEALKDPAFLQKALEATRSQATPVFDASGHKPNTPKTIPSLSRQTAAAGNDEEPEDAVEVFTNAIRGKR